MRNPYTFSTIKHISSRKLLDPHVPSPFAYMGYPLSPYTDMGCTCIHTLHYDYYPTYIGLQSLGVTEPMFIHRRCTTLHYVFMHIPPSSFMGTCPPSSYMGLFSVCVSPPHLLSLHGSKLGGPLPRFARWTARLFKAHLAMHHLT
jgi:hypothetical protein